MIREEDWYSNPRLEMALTDFAPGDWRDEFEPDATAEEDEDDSDAGRH